MQKLTPHYCPLPVKLFFSRSLRAPIFFFVAALFSQGVLDEHVAAESGNHRRSHQASGGRHVVRVGVDSLRLVVVVLLVDVHLAQHHQPRCSTGADQAKLVADGAAGGHEPVPAIPLASARPGGRGGALGGRVRRAATTTRRHRCQTADIELSGSGEKTRILFNFFFFCLCCFSVCLSI